MEYRRFESDVIIRPDDIDMNNHVHVTKYIDYYLSARYDQMERCYKMSMDEFIKRGWTWFIKSVEIDYKRQLKLGDGIVVRTWIDSFSGADVKIRFQILKKTGMKVAAEGHVINTLVSIETGRSAEIPEWIIQQYAQFVEEA
jgi:acyl-CoA thioester hydrolase/thioesterase-3